MISHHYTVIVQLRSNAVTVATYQIATDERSLIHILVSLLYCRTLLTADCLAADVRIYIHPIDLYE
jgi:hypothetical protein